MAYKPVLEGTTFFVHCIFCGKSIRGGETGKCNLPGPITASVVAHADVDAKPFTYACGDCADKQNRKG